MCLFIILFTEKHQSPAINNEKSIVERVTSHFTELVGFIEKKNMESFTTVDDIFAHLIFHIAIFFIKSAWHW